MAPYPKDTSLKDWKQLLKKQKKHYKSAFYFIYSYHRKCKYCFTHDENINE